MSKTTEPIFSDDTLLRTPLFYRLMSRLTTAEIGELKAKVRFSESTRHFSREYINHTSHRPIAYNDYFEIIDAS